MCAGGHVLLQKIRRRRCGFFFSSRPSLWPTRRSNKNASQKAGLDTHKSLKTRLHCSCPESRNIIGRKEQWGQREEKELQRAETELQFCGCAHCHRLSVPQFMLFLPSKKDGLTKTQNQLALLLHSALHTLLHKFSLRSLRKWLSKRENRTNLKVKWVD